MQIHDGDVRIAMSSWRGLVVQDSMLASCYAAVYNEWVITEGCLT